MCVLQFEGQPGEEFQEEASQLCSQQSQARELIKNKRRKDPRFAHIIQVATPFLMTSSLLLLSLLLLLRVAFFLLHAALCAHCWSVLAGV